MHPRVSHRGGAVCLAAALALAVVQPAATAGMDAPRDCVIRGKVFESDGETPIAGAGVRAAHLETGEILEGGRSAGNGRYELRGVPQGNYDLVFESPAGTFVSNVVIFVPPSGKAVASFALTVVEQESPKWWAPDPRRIVPGTDRKADGVAWMMEDGRAKPFWKTKKGIAALAGSGVLLTILLSDSGDGEPASPSNP